MTDTRTELRIITLPISHAKADVFVLFVPFPFPYIAFLCFLTPWIVQVSRLAWSRGYFFGLGLGLTVIGLGLGLSLMKYWS